MKRENFKNKKRISDLKERKPTVDLAAAAEMSSTRTAVVFQGRKRYAEAEEEE